MTNKLTITGNPTDRFVYTVATVPLAGGIKTEDKSMRTKEEIENLMSKLKTLFAQLYSTDSEASIRVYGCYRELYWVLHPEINDDVALAHAVNKALELEQWPRAPHRDAGDHLPGVLH